LVLLSQSAQFLLILELNSRTTRKSIPTETRHVAQKRCPSMQKCGLWPLGQTSDALTAAPPRHWVPYQVPTSLGTIITV